MAARFVTANGLRFAYRSWGDAGPLAVLVHGFPDTPATWRHLGPVLARAGYRVVAPWTRGYAPTSVPADGDYHRDTLAADLNRLHEALGGDGQAVLVGHDWGAIAAARATAAAPDRWRRLVTLAIPPERAVMGLPSLARQLRMSWYFLPAQLPLERLGLERVFPRLVDLWRAWSPGYEPTSEDLDNLRQSLAAPGSLAAALGYYRSARREVLTSPTAFGRVPVPTQPTLHVHGADDGCLDPGLVDPSGRVLQRANPASRAVLLDRVGHFLHLERPDHVASLVLDWFAHDET